jgi:hypothetical protein
MAEIAGIYPLSSQDGKAIPLDVVKPSSLVKFNFVAGVAADVTIPAGYLLCWVFATKPCILRLSAVNLPAALVAGTAYDKALYIPQDMPLTVVLTPGEASLLGLAADGELYINAVEQWGALLQSKQASVG